MPTLKADVAVIGGGMAGLPIANKCAYKGLRTVLFEQELLGGTCLNRGCIPTKTMIESARVAHAVRTASRFGIGADEPAVDLAAIVRRKDEVLTSIRDNAYRQVAQNEHLTLVEGLAVFETAHRLRAEVEGGEAYVVEAEHVVVNTGTRPARPSIEGLDAVPYHTSRTLLNVTEVPSSLVVIGGGYVGVEFAQMFARFGSRVAILQRASRLVAGEDPEVGVVIAEVFREEGIEVVLGADVRRARCVGEEIEVIATVSSAERRFCGAALLVAAGRVPNTDGLGLERAGVETDERGFVVADAAFRTSQPGVWAIGDVTGGAMFTHAARDAADRLYRRIVKGEDATIEDRHVPYAIFTDPEIAAVGLTEEAAREAGFDVKVGRHPFTRVARAKAAGQTAGFVKIVADAATDRLLGGHIVGLHAGELIHELVVALELGATYTQISRVLHVHPTLAEGVNSAAGGVHRPAGDV